MARPADRLFRTFRRGEVRDQIILAHFRNELRNAINPDTGQLFDESEIAIITQRGSRFYREADAIDLYGQATQARAQFLADQMIPSRAASEFLKKHGGLWGIGVLPATGGSGNVTATGSVGTVYVGSTTIPDPTATVIRDPSTGKKYQVLVTVTLPASGTAPVAVQGIDTGSDTNPLAGAELAWVNPPDGSDPTASVIADFKGGFDAETEQERARRIEDRMARRAASGNPAHFRAWAQQASVAVDQAFVYATAQHAGSVQVVVLEKRGSAKGPLARIPAIGTLSDVTAFLVPPSSPVVPGRVFVIVGGPTSEPSDLVLALPMKKGAAGGWFDPDPWPGFTAAAPEVQSSPAPTQTTFRMNSDTALPGGTSVLSGADAPSLMLWDQSTSRWERLQVSSVTDAGGGLYDVVLSSAAVVTIAAGMRVSPYTDRLDTIAETIEAHFDTLGPGELLDLTNDVRATRAFRDPRPEVIAPFKVGQGVVSRLDEVFGGALAEAELKAVSVTTPSVPGPNLLTIGEVAIVDLP